MTIWVTASRPSDAEVGGHAKHFKDVDLMLFDKVIAFDHLRQKIILIVNMPLDEPETGYNKAVMELETACGAAADRSKEAGTVPGGCLGEVTPLFDRRRLTAEWWSRPRHHIREGDIFQIVLSNRLSAPL